MTAVSVRMDKYCMLDVITIWLTIYGKNNNYVTLKQTVDGQQIYIL